MKFLQTNCLPLYSFSYPHWTSCQTDVSLWHWCWLYNFKMLTMKGLLVLQSDSLPIALNIIYYILLLHYFYFVQIVYASDNLSLMKQILAYYWLFWFECLYIHIYIYIIYIYIIYIYIYYFRSLLLLNKANCSLLALTILRSQNVWNVLFIPSFSKRLSRDSLNDKIVTTSQCVIVCCVVSLQLWRGILSMRCCLLAVDLMVPWCSGSLGRFLFLVTSLYSHVS